MPLHIKYPTLSLALRPVVITLIISTAKIIVGFTAAWKLNIISGVQRERITALFYPEQYKDVLYQQTNGKIALGSGGWIGEGYLHGSMTQSGSVPVNESDMILTVAH